MGDLGWQDWGCVQCTSMSLPCEVDCQSHLAAKWWGHGVCHIGVYGTYYMQLTWCWHDPGQWAGQLGWSGSGRDVWTNRGATYYPQLQCWPWCGVRLFPYCWHLQAVSPLYKLHYTMGYGHHLPQSPLGECLTFPQSTALMNSLSHGGVSSVLNCTISALFSFPQCWWWGVFSAPLDLVSCWPAVP